MRRIQIEKDDLVGSEAREDRLADDALVGGGVETREVPVEPVAVRTDVRELLALGDLERVERGKRLELDELRNEPAGLLRDREIRDGEDGQIVAARHVEALRHRGERSLQGRRGGELAEDLERGLHHLVAQRRRQKHRRLGETEGDLHPAPLRETLGVGAVTIFRESRVVGATELGDHAGNPRRASMHRRESIQRRKKSAAGKRNPAAVKRGVLSRRRR